MSKTIKITLIVFVSLCLFGLFLRHITFYQGHQRRMKQPDGFPKFLRPHYRGSGQGSTGFALVMEDMAFMNIISLTHPVRFTKGNEIMLKEMIGYYYTTEEVILEARKTSGQIVFISVKDNLPEQRGFRITLKDNPPVEGYEYVSVLNAIPYHLLLVLTLYAIAINFLLLVFFFFRSLLRILLRRRSSK